MNILFIWINPKYKVSISGLDPDSPHPQPWQSKIVTRNKVHRLYSQQLFYSARAGGLGCLDQDQISILYVLFFIYVDIFLVDAVRSYNNNYEDNTTHEHNEDYINNTDDKELMQVNELTGS